MPNVTPEIRELIVRAKKCGKRTKDIAEFFGVSRKTVWKWVKRAYHPGKESFRDRSRRPHNIKKIVTPVIENAIIILRDSFNWGIQRIKIALKSPPPYIRYLLEHVLGVKWKDIDISRQSINEVLRKHRRNSSPYSKGKRDWKYFRAKSPEILTEPTVQTK